MAKKGQVFDFIGQPIHPALLGLLANFGVSQVQVRKMPKILVLTTGSELVEVNENPLPPIKLEKPMYILFWV